MTRKQLFRPFWNMTYEGIPDFSRPEDFGDMAALIPCRGRAQLLLGCYGEAEIRERLEYYSCASRLRELGVPDYTIRIDASDPDHQELRLFPVPQEGERAELADEPIGEVILREVLLTPDPELVANIRPSSMLVVQWLRLQDPRQQADPRTLLPGQKYPGLGLGRKVMEMLVAIAEKRGLEGIVNRPEFIHNAWLYSPHFRYLDPVAEGRLQALKRDLSDLSLWQVAWATQKGFVLEDGRRNFFRWYQGEQVYPLAGPLRRFFQEGAWERAVEAAREAAQYSLAPYALDRL